MLSLSIRDNIAYGRDATMDQIEEAAKIAHAHTFISSLENGYDTQVKLDRHDRAYSSCLADTYIFNYVLSGGNRFFPFYICMGLFFFRLEGQA